MGETFSKNIVGVFETVREYIILKCLFLPQAKQIVSFAFSISSYKVLHFH